MRFAATTLAALVLLAPTAQARSLVSESESRPYPGIRLVSRVESNPANRIHIAYVSLCNDYLHVDATRAPSSLRTPGAWAGSIGAQLATNGDFFTSGPQVYGDAVGGGVRWPTAQTGLSASGTWYYQDYGWIAFGDDWVEFSHTSQTKTTDASRFNPRFGWQPTTVTESLPSGTQSLVSGFPELVIEGQVYTCSSPTDASCFPDRSDMRARHPRTAMGLTRDRKTFILVTVDGRNSPTSLGMYGAELAELMGDLGAWQAFNLDGGGSTAMWVQGQGYVNRPSDGTARSVANHWGIFAGTAGGKARDPGSCFVAGGCYATRVPGALGSTFKDMPPGSFAYDEAILLYEANITNGCQTTPDRMFCPGCELTRAQAVTFLIKAAGIDTSSPPSSPTFGDVATSAWYYPFVEAAAREGITSGCGSGNFCPNDVVTRAQIAAFIVRTLGWPNANPATPTFDDVPTTHTFYRPIETMKEYCITNGCGGNDYCPDRDVTRGEAAIFIARAFNLGDINPCLATSGSGGAGGNGGSLGSGGTTSGGGSTGMGASGGSTAGGGSGGGGWPGAAGHGATSGASPNDEGGCGCRAAGRSGPGQGWLLLLAALAIWRRRRGPTTA